MTDLQITQGTVSALEGWRYSTLNEIKIIASGIVQKHPELQSEMDALMRQVLTMKGALKAANKQLKLTIEELANVVEERDGLDAMYDDLVTAMFDYDRDNRMVRDLVNVALDTEAAQFGDDDDFTERVLDRMSAGMSEQTGVSQALCYSFLEAVVLPGRVELPDYLNEWLVEAMYEWRSARNAE